MPLLPFVPGETSGVEGASIVPTRNEPDLPDSSESVEVFDIRRPDQRFARVRKTSANGPVVSE
jgi:hypothetical protein